MNRVSRSMNILLAVWCVVGLSSALFGQATYTAQLRGVVMDPSGAVIPFATVKAKNEETGIENITTTDAQGRYLFPGLKPSIYTLRVEAQGFRALVQSGVELRVTQQADLDFNMEVGQTSETIQVTAESPLLNTVSATLGTAVTNRYIMDMPLLDRGLTNLTFLAPGVTEVAGAGADDIKGTNFVSNGQRNATAEVRLDGGLSTVPESGEGGNSSVNYQPSVEVIQEFNVENNSFSAEYGNNGGTVVNVITKSGTNEFHGSGWWFFRRPGLDANDFFSNQGGEGKGEYKRDEWGGSVGGPIKHDRTFFFFDFLKRRDDSPFTLSTTVPTALQKVGDFSDTLNDDGSLQQIFNPLNVTEDADGNLLREAFPNNVVPAEVMDPAAPKVLALYPDATGDGEDFTHRFNYTRKLVNSYPSYQFDIKLDHLFTANSRISGRYSRGHSNGTTPSAEGQLLDSATSHGTDQNVVLEHSWTPTPTLYWTNRIGVDRSYYEQVADPLDPTSVGLSPELNGYFGLKRFPEIGPDEYGYLGQSCCTDTVKGQTQYMFSSMLTKIAGAHTFKMGGEARIFFNNFWQPDYPTGQFAFERSTTTESVFEPDYSQGNSLASLLVGWGTWGHVGTQPPTANKSRDQGVFIQDDWKVSDRLTLNLGLRYEWSDPFTERFNRLVVVDYNGDTGIDVPGLGPLKGTSYLANNDKRTANVDRNNFAPRIGFAYRIDDKTVLRGGAGVYYGFNVATNFQYVGTPWYKNVNINFSKDGGVTQFASLSNPFPVGFYGPPGDKYGKLSQWGFDNGYNLNDGLRNAEVYQWNIGIQRELPGDILIEVNYSANRSNHLPFNGYDGTRNRNFLSKAAREQYGSEGLAELVDNPFQPFFQGPNAIFNEPDSIYNDAQIERAYLLRPYPQFAGSFGGYPEFIANSRYSALQLRFEKRYSQGLAFTGNYTFSHMTDDNSLGFNPWIGSLQSQGELQDLTNLSAEKSISGFDTPHRLAFAVTYELPIGRGKAVGQNLRPVANALLGGWKVNGFITLQSGNPLGILMSDGRLADGNQRPNISGDPRGADVRTVVDGLASFFNDAAFSDPGDQVPGNSPRYFDQLRTDGINNLDFSMFKDFQFREGMLLQFRAEFFNFFNTPRFGPPDTSYGSSDFGYIYDQSNRPRNGQIGIRFVW